jgi:hypothetical protein
MHSGSSATPQGWWPVVVAALAFSIPFHLAIAVWLSGVVGDPAGTTEPAVLATVETAATGQAQDMPPEPEPVQPPPVPMPQSVATEPDPAWQATPREPAAMAMEPQSTQAVEPVPSMAPGLAAVGSAATSQPQASAAFFGTRAKGNRFAFVVDKSASMQGGRMEQAVDEVVRSVRALPDFAEFRVCFFDTGMAMFPDRGFRKARDEPVAQLATWVQGVRPHGGTTPRPAFERIMSDAAAPDAIFFMTDGQIPSEDPAWIIRRVQSRLGMVPVHCVAFGDDRAVPQLREIARQTGGQFRFVPGGGR